MECIKRKIISWCVLLSICSLLYSCDEDIVIAENVLETGVPIEEIVSDGIKIEDGYLNFESVSAFEAVLGEDNAENKTSLLQKTKSSRSYISWGDSFNAGDHKGLRNAKTSADEEVLGDEFLSNVMNQDGILKIGAHWFKIMYNEEIVLALYEDKQASYQDLVVANIDNPDIMQFSTNDEVLTLLEEGSTGTMTNGRVQFFCFDKTAERRKDTDTERYGANGDYRLKCSIRYRNFGVLFKLVAKVNNQVRDPLNLIWIAQEGLMRVDYNATYEPVCKSVKYDSGSIDRRDNGHKKEIYESIRPLHKYKAEAKFFNDAFGGVASSRIYRVNYKM